MRRPEERSPRTINPFGVVLALFALGSTLVFGRAAEVGVAMALALVFIGVQVSRPTRRYTIDLAILAAPGALFLLSVIALLLGATPFTPGGGHPLWLLIGQGGGAAVDLEADWIGLLELLGLAFAFLAATRIGAQAQTARSLPDTMILLGAALSASAVVAQAAKFLAGRSLEGWPTPLYAYPGLESAMCGLTAILSSERLLHARRDKGPRAHDRKTAAAAIQAIYLPVAALAVSLIGLALAALTSLIIVLTMVALLAAWTVLSSGGDTRIPRRVLIWLTPIAAGLAIVVAILVANAFSETPNAVISRSAHWNAFWASPWAGYGLDAQNAVAKLVMTRLNLYGLTAYPTPSTAYLVWLEQGGLLGFIPIAAGIVWATATILFSSLRARRLAGPMRAVVCSSLFLSVFALISAGPSMPSIEIIWAALLGLGYGAASSAR